jgi:hypothetical protein
MPFFDFVAELKYDRYEQFAPGMKFAESLARWLAQFETPEQREAAYRFVIHRLVYISDLEMRHLIETAFPDHIQAEILRRAAIAADLPAFRVTAIRESVEYSQLCRQSLFLGLSDGARTDLLRRLNPSLSNEQVWQAYELGPDKARSMVGDLRKALKDNSACFNMLWLLDDFSGSGRSYIRQEEDGMGKVEWKGKIPKAYKQFFHSGGPAREAVSADAEVFVVLYCATPKSVTYMREQSGPFTDWCRRTYERADIRPPIIKVVDPLDAGFALSENNPEDAAFLALVDSDRYYDHTVFDEHFAKGGTTDAKRGFAGACLPLVLHHNTPNNSVFLLWADETRTVRGLFPRISRHKSET